MQLVATLEGRFFRAQSVTDGDIEQAKEAMLQDKEGLQFEVVTDEKFEAWLLSQ